MKNEAEKLLQLGLGAAMITKEAVEEAVNSLVKKGKIGKEDAKKVLADLSKKGKDAQSEISKSMDSAFKSMLKKLDIPTRDEVEELRKEIDKLKKG